MHWWSHRPPCSQNISQLCWCLPGNYEYFLLWMQLFVCLIISWLFPVILGALAFPGGPWDYSDHPSFFWVPLLYLGFTCVAEWTLVCLLTYWWSHKILVFDPKCLLVILSVNCGSWAPSGVFLSAPSWMWAPHSDHNKPWSSSPFPGCPESSSVVLNLPLCIEPILVFLIVPCW